MLIASHPYRAARDGVDGVRTLSTSIRSACWDPGCPPPSRPPVRLSARPSVRPLALFSSHHGQASLGECCVTGSRISHRPSPPCRSETSRVDIPFFSFPSALSSSPIHNIHTSVGGRYVSHAAAASVCCRAEDGTSLVAMNVLGLDRSRKGVPPRVHLHCIPSHRIHAVPCGNSERGKERKRKKQKRHHQPSSESSVRERSLCTPPLAKRTPARRRWGRFREHR